VESFILASKYFGKYDWLKTSENGDEKEEKMAMNMLFNSAAEEGENPLETFTTKSEKDLQSEEMIRQVLRKDKEIIAEKYAQQMGVNAAELLSKAPQLRNPIKDIQEDQDQLCVKAMGVIRLIEEMHKKYLEEKDDEDMEEDEKEDLKDRIEMAAEKIQKCIEEFKHKIEIDLN
jgi:predicted metal-dependent hydrolase